MADPPRYPDAGDDPGAGPDRTSTTGTPRWVKVFAIVALIVIVLFVVLLIFDGGRHGPDRHTGSGSNTASGAPGSHAGRLAGVTHGEQQP